MPPPGVAIRRQALCANKMNRAAMFNRAKQLLYSGRFDEAEEILNSLLKGVPPDIPYAAKYWISLGMVRSLRPFFSSVSREFRRIGFRAIRGDAVALCEATTVAVIVRRE